MKLLVNLQEKNVFAIVKDSYEGPSQSIPMPDDFDENRMNEYVVNDDLSISIPKPVINFKFLVQKRLDDFAKTKDYNDMMSVTSYVSSTVEQYQNDATYAISARDDTWQTYYELMNEIESGEREEFSSFDELEALLPVLGWPVEQEEVANNDVVVEESNNEVVLEESNNDVVVEESNNDVVVEESNNEVVLEESNNDVVVEESNTEISEANTEPTV